ETALQVQEALPFIARQTGQRALALLELDDKPILGFESRRHQSLEVETAHSGLGPFAGTCDTVERLLLYCAWRLPTAPLHQHVDDRLSLCRRQIALQLANQRLLLRRRH